MANIHMIILVSLLLLPLAFYYVTADLDVDFPFHGLSKKTVVVEGMVYCQSCEKLGTSSLSEANPIPLAQISVTCINHITRGFYNKVYTSNENGYFYAKLGGISMEYILSGYCYVKLVSSPIESCDIPTNINNGTTGALLRFEHKRLITRKCDTKFYAAGPLAFRPNHCSADDTRY